MTTEELAGIQKKLREGQETEGLEILEQLLSTKGVRTLHRESLVHRGMWQHQMDRERQGRVSSDESRIRRTELRMNALTFLDRIADHFEVERPVFDNSAPTSAAPKLWRTFMSYAHEDEGEKNELEKRLLPLGVELWHDRMIPAGMEWEGKINYQIDKADLIILLVSKYFLESKFCMEKELPRTLERYKLGIARVVPVILADCDWSSAGFNHIQALPAGAVPLDNWPNREDGYQSILNSIGQIIDFK